MATLLDTLKQTRQTTPLGQTERVQKLFAGRTGSAATETGPGAVNLAERVAGAEVQAVAQDLASQARMGDIASGQAEQKQQQQFQSQEAQLQLQEQKLDQELQQRSRKILNDLTRAGREVDLQRDAFELAQLGQSEALQDKEYILQLEREGNLRRLGDSNQFRQELQESIFSDLIDLYENRGDFARDMAMSDADFAKKLADIEIDGALRVADLAATQGNSRSIFEGLGSLGSSALEFGESYADGKFK